MTLRRVLISIIVMAITFSLMACNDEKISRSKSIKSVSIEGLAAKADYPKGIAFDDYDGNRSVRENNPVTTEYLNALNSFTVKSTAQLLNTQERTTNIMYSPMSLYMTLALSASGAKNQTQEEILSILSMEKLGIDQLQTQTSNLFRLLYTDNKIGKLRLANSLWLDKDISFKQDFIDTASKDYYTSVFSVDFSDEATGDMVSKWLAENSNGTLEGTSPVNKEQIMSMINTIYFYDEWVNRFDVDNTKKDIFHSYDGNQVKCEFMNMTFGSHGFIDGEGYIASSLGFKNQGAMNFYLPDEGVDPYDLIETPEKVKALLHRDNLTNVRKNGKVVFKVPKFDFDSTLYLKESLKRMGMERAFEEDADFTGLTDYYIAYISNIMQSTHISIDEKGCEASAFTRIDYAGSAPPKDKAEMILDRPFIFTITSSNNTILFIGIINNPAA